jgi:hypothetical protein
MASSSVSQDDIENNYERLERRSRIRTARARQINPQVHIFVVSVADSGCLSRIRIFSVPDPNFFHPGSRICIKEFKYFYPKTNGF